MQLNIVMLAIVPLFSFAPVAQAQSTTERIPAECYACFNEWQSYKHDRDAFIVGSCEEALRDPPPSGRLAKLKMSNLRQRFPSLPFIEFDIPENPDCRQITMSAQQWVYNHHMASCLPQVPASCHQRFPRP
jgi:hypothetical protein